MDVAQDDTIIERARQGDGWALQMLYEEARRTVFHLALAIVGDPGGAEEVMQDTLFYALTHLQQYDAARAPWAVWLHTITVSRSRNYLRRRRFSLHGLRVLADAVSTRPSPPALAEQREQSQLLRSAMGRLSPKLREAVALRFLADYSFAEIGAIVGCSAKTAQSRVRLGMEKLRVLIEGDPTWVGIVQEG